MAEYFQCRNYCTDCCPKTDNRIFALVTIGDAYRTFVKLWGGYTFSEACRDQFDLYAFNLQKMVEARIKKNRRKDVVVVGGNQSLIPDLYMVSFGSKRPCMNLTDIECKVHGEMQKYLNCIIEPESSIIGKIDAPESIKRIYPCFDEDQKVPKKYHRVIEELESMFRRELQITADITPYIIITDNEGKECFPISNISDSETVEKNFWELFERFNNPMNMLPWYDEIMDHCNRLPNLLKELCGD